MSTSGSYDVSTAHRDAESEIQRLRAQVLMHWDQEATVLDRFGLRDGIDVLELGSGPGFVTEQLLQLVPNGSVTAVEIDSTLVKRAEEYLEVKAEGRLRVVHASVMNTGLPENSFDFAYARLLFQHLPDPVGAAREVFRVLKPGGTLVIGDIDDAFTVFEPRLPEVEMVMNKMAQAQAARGGNRFIGRRLVRLLKEAEFQNPQMEAVVFHTDIAGMQAASAQIDPDRMLPLVRAGLLSEREIDAVRAAREKFLSSEPLLMYLFFLVGAEK